MNEISNEEKCQLIEKVQERSEFMLNIVEKFLSISKMEAGNIEMNLEEKDVVSFVSGIVDFYNHVALRKKITVFFQSNVNSLNLKYDANRLEQVFTNLLSNAVKFSYPGKSVYVHVKLVGNNIFFYVIDEGQGIPAAEIKKLFVPFSKTSIVSTANEPSTGLGLAIAKKIVELHGGKMFVESSEGKGSTFYFSLPVSL
jgi:signal transduction histidine kinase